MYITGRAEILFFQPAALNSISGLRPLLLVAMTRVFLFTTFLPEMQDSWPGASPLYPFSNAFNFFLNFLFYRLNLEIYWNEGEIEEGGQL